MERILQSVALALVLALLASPAAAVARCASMQPQTAHCPHQPALHCPDCPEPEGAAASVGQQPLPMDGPCCHMAPARPSPRTDVQAPAPVGTGIPLVRTITVISPALPAPPPPQREAVFLLPAESPQAVLCIFLI